MPVSYRVRTLAGLALAAAAATTGCQRVARPPMKCNVCPPIQVGYAVAQEVVVYPNRVPSEQDLKAAPISQPTLPPIAALPQPTAKPLPSAPMPTVPMPAIPTPLPATPKPAAVEPKTKEKPPAKLPTLSPPTELPPVKPPAPLDFQSRQGNAGAAILRPVSATRSTFGHAPDYTALIGELYYSHALKCWRVRYAGIGEEDQYGGSLTLEAADFQVQGFKPWQVVRVEGRITQARIGHAGSVFLVSRIIPAE